MESVKESTAPKNATSQTDSVNNWMKNEAAYQTTMLIIRKWLDNGLITDNEYALLNHKFEGKYSPKIRDLGAE